MLKRIWENLKWLFNHPPITLTAATNKPQCDYCDGFYGCWDYEGVFCICTNCMKKAFDKILKEK